MKKGKRRTNTRRRREYEFEEESAGVLELVLSVLAVLMVIGVLVGAFFLYKSWSGGGSGKETAAEGEKADWQDTEEDSGKPGQGDESAADEGTVSSEYPEDPQDDGQMSDQEAGASADVKETLEQESVRELLIGDGAQETREVTIGIDVSRYQGTIDWAQVAASGIDFAMIRAGYRTVEEGKIVEDTNARYNLQEATANGIKAGVYFFSTAVSEAEAVEEAQWVKKLISGYRITYPVAYDCEGYEKAGSRQNHLTREERTALAEAFLKEVHAGGYTPMFYSAKGELENDSKWLTSQLEQSYKMWVSWYPQAPFPQTQSADYDGKMAMWQYTNQGTVEGVPEKVDINVAYFGYEAEADSRGEAAVSVEADAEALMNFTEVSERVTAKNATNLRDIPSQGEDSTVMLTLQNGQVAVRTGISDSGWSRVEYEGKVYYAVSSYLTTDLTAKVPEPEVDDGIDTEFTKVSDKVTPKIEVNLRTLPSVTREDAVVAATISNGEVVVRTGVNTDLGWSRVEYNGQVLYCVSSYLSVVE